MPNKLPKFFAIRNLKKYVKDDKEKLKVFDRNGVYLLMKKVGKNNQSESRAD